MTTKQKPNTEGCLRLAAAICKGIDEELENAIESGNHDRIIAGYKTISSDFYDAISLGNSINRLNLYHNRIVATGTGSL